MLEELASKPLVGLALWEGLRDLTLWTHCDDQDLRTLFNDSGALFRDYAPSAFVADAPELLEAWHLLESVAMRPSNVQRERIAEACKGVYAWAEERAFMQTAAHFAEAAALVLPNSPLLANLAARTCRRAGLPTRAGPWYQRGKILAVHADSFYDKFSASVGYGWLMYSLGRYDRARRVINSTVRSAVNEGHKRMAGEAEHALLAICSEVGMFNAGEAHALHALKRYPDKHERLPALVHDIGYFYVTAGVYSAALTVLQDAVKAFYRPQEQTVVISTLARAAAGAEQEAIYQTARDTVLSLAPRYPEHAAAAWRNIAFAAQHAEDWELAEHAALAALRLADERRMNGIVRTSRELLDKIKAREPGAPETALPALSLASEITRISLFKLKRWHGPNRGRPPGQTPPA